MTAREFPIERVDAGDAARGSAAMAYRIRCTCGAVAYYPLKRGVRKRTHESIPTQFRSYGWHVGITERKDRCPECLKREPAKAEPSPEETRPMTTTRQAPAAAAAPLRAEPPREMKPADRQIIFAKISDVYCGERYTGGWTDKKVADDLGVPLAWVREIRDMMCGPEGSNPILDEFLKSCADFDREYAAVMEVRKKHLEDGTSLRRRLDDLDSKARDIAGLTKRVEREIGR